MIKRKCPICGKSITRLHGNAKFCKNCSRLRANELSRKWWKENNYSEIVATRRNELKIPS